MSIDGQIEKLLAEYNRDPNMVPNVRAYLTAAARIGAEIEREECEVAAAGAGDAGDTAFERGAKIRIAIRARGGK